MLECTYLCLMHRYSWIHCYRWRCQDKIQNKTLAEYLSVLLVLVVGLILGFPTFCRGCISVVCILRRLWRPLCRHIPYQVWPALWSLRQTARYLVAGHHLQQDIGLALIVQRLIS